MPPFATFVFERIYNFFRFGKLRSKYSYYGKHSSTDKLFDESLTTKTKWKYGEADNYDTHLIGSPTYNAWKIHDGGHKWLHYFPIYDKIFSPYFGREIKLLEIGVYKGASAKMWSSLFPAKTLYVGIDIDPECAKFQDKKNNIFIEIGSQSDQVFLQQIVNKYGPFDIIIDDGSHITSDMVNSFNALFDSGLNEGGIYFVEDTHTNYWRGYRDQAHSFIDIAKRCVDIQGYHYIDNKFETFLPKEEEQFLDVPKLTTLLEEVRFFDSVVVFEKKIKSHAPITIHL